MRIEEIRLTNYRQYKEQKIPFSSGTEEKHLFVVQGAMGTGKTNILNAIYWCLYGEELDITDKNKGKPLINDIARHSSKKGDELSVKVEIVMQDEEKKKLIFSREKKFERGENPNSCKPIYDGSNSKDGTKFYILQEKEKYQFNPVPGDPDEVINKTFPNEISRYFLFNGETLDKYFREAKNIQQEVYNLSQLKILNIVINHLSERIREMNSEFKDSNPEATRYLELKEKCEEELGNTNIRLEQLNSKKIQLTNISNTLHGNLRNSSSENVKNLENERENLAQEIERLNGSKKYNEQMRDQYLISMMPKMLTYSSIRNTLLKIEEKRSKGEFPPKIDPDFVKEILKSKRCICGADLSKKDDAQERIKELLKAFNIDRELTVQISDMEVRLKEIAREVSGFSEKQPIYSTEIKRCQDSINRINVRLEKIDEDIRGSDIEQIVKWENELKEVESERDRILYQIAEAKGIIEDKKKESDNYKNQYEKELSKIKEKEKLTNKLKFCLEAQRVLNTLKDKIMEEIREAIQKATEEQFFKLIWKKDSYSEVNIDDEYNISAKDMHGYECIGTLSAGERQILALSFMAALNTVSGFKFPIIIDTPLARISKEPRANIARNLHNYLKGRQVILLVTEEEYTKEVQELMEENVCQEYIIKFYEKTQGSESELIPKQ